MKEQKRIAVFLGLAGGFIYAKAVTWFLGYAMAWSWPDQLIQFITNTPSVAVFLTSVMVLIALLTIVALPISLFLRFLFKHDAIVAAVAMVAGAFAYLNLTSLLSIELIWRHLTSWPSLAITEMLAIYGGPIALVWVLGLTHNMALKRDPRDASRPAAP
jgi:hypothetical protein